MKERLIPELRTITSVLVAFTAQDTNTALTEHLMHYIIDNGYIHAPKVGSKYIVNLDELIEVLNTPNNKVCEHSVPQGYGMKYMAEVVALFKAADGDTLMCKSMLRSMRRDGQISVVESSKQWFIDLDGLLAKFGAFTSPKTEHQVPLLRTLEESELALKYTFRKHRLTTKMITDIVHSGEVFKVNYGNRWIINYSQVQTIIRWRFTADLTFEPSEWERLQKDVSQERNRKTAAK